MGKMFIVDDCRECPWLIDIVEDDYPYCVRAHDKTITPYTKFIGNFPDFCPLDDWGRNE